MGVRTYPGWCPSGSPNSGHPELIFFLFNVCASYPPSLEGQGLTYQYRIIMVGFFKCFTRFPLISEIQEFFGLWASGFAFCLQHDKFLCLGSNVEGCNSGFDPWFFL